MRLNENERQVLKNALEEHAEAFCGEDEDEYQATKKMLSRLEKFEELSERNRKGGLANSLKIQGKLDFFKGYTGKTYEEHLKLKAESVKSEE